MTTVVCNRTHMAADTLAVNCTKIRVKKVHRLFDGSLVGGSGVLADIMAALALLQGDQSVTEWPKDDDGNSTVWLLRLYPGGRIEEYNGRHPFEVRQNFASIGSGAMAARACYSMNSRASLKKIIECVADGDPATGHEVEVFKV